MSNFKVFSATLFISSCFISFAQAMNEDDANKSKTPTTKPTPAAGVTSCGEPVISTPFVPEDRMDDYGTCLLNFTPVPPQLQHLDLSRSTVQYTDLSSSTIQYTDISSSHELIEVYPLYNENGTSFTRWQF